MGLKFVTDLFTESDNKTYSMQRVGAATGLLMAALAFTSQMWHNTLTPEVYQAFAMAWSAILVSGGVGAKLTPEAPNNG